MRIETLSVSQLSHALSTFLLSAEGAPPSTEDCHVVFKILTEWSIPVADTVVNEGSSDYKVMSSRLALSILSISRNEFGEAIGSLIGKWHGDDGQWKVAFHSATQIVVGTIISTLLKLHCVPAGQRKQLGGGSRHPTGLNGSSTIRYLLTSCSKVPSSIERGVSLRCPCHRVLIYVFLPRNLSLTHPRFLSWRSRSFSKHSPRNSQSFSTSL